MSERKKIVFFICFIGVILSVLAYMSEGDGYGGGDSIQHFLISKYCFRHPELFLHHWGKPFFTLFSSPFSQFGFLGINIFNILCACLTSWFAYDLSVKWEIKNAWLSFFLLLFAPIYFVCIISGLTEVFFAAVLMVSIWLFERGKLMLSSVIVSFLPFIRMEGILLLPLFAIILLTRRKITVLIGLVTGTILYSIIGGFYFNDFLWITHQNPYKGAETLYGHGTLTFFAERNEYILGTVGVVLFLIGLITIISGRIKAKFAEIFLTLGSFLFYFIAHSVFWHKGLFGSDGLIRVMAAITPMATFTCLHGFNFLMSFLKKYSALQNGMTVIIVLLIVWMPFKQHQFPRPLDYESVSIKQAGDWIKKNYLEGEKIYGATPFMWVVLNKDPFDVTKTSDFYAIDKQHPEKNIQSGNIVIWDSHFSPNEGGVSLEKLSQNYFFRQLKRFETDPRLVPQDKGRFEVYIFQKI